MIEPSTCSHPTSARQKGANQHARWENCSKCQQRLSTEKRDYWKEAKILREKALEKEEMARRMEEQKNRAFRSAPRRPRPRARVPTLKQMNDQLRNDQPSKPESGAIPGPASRAPIVAASSSTNDHLEEVLKGQAQQAKFLQHMWVQQSQMQQALQQQVCALTGGIQQLAETQQVAASGGMDIRGDAAKDLARVVRDGSTSEGQRLREQLWVWFYTYRMRKRLSRCRNKYSLG